MFTINDELKEKISNINNLLEIKYKNIFDLDKTKFRQFIEDNVGQIKKMTKLNKDKLADFHSSGGIVGVDGSNNRIGGAYPHYIEIFQALAKSTYCKNEPLFKTDIYTPLIPEHDENPLEVGEMIIEDKKNIKLANLEVEAALESIDKFKPYAIMMDGGLIRYNIYAYDKWLELKSRCEEEGIILFGVIKDIKTSVIGDLIVEKNSEYEKPIYDKEILLVS